MSKSKEALRQQGDQPADRQGVDDSDRLTVDERTAIGGQANYGLGRESRRDFPRRSTANQEARGQRGGSFSSREGSPRYSRQSEPYSSRQYNQQASRQRRADDFDRSDEGQRYGRGGGYETRQRTGEDSGDFYSRSIRERMGGDEGIERRNQSRGGYRSYDRGYASSDQPDYRNSDRDYESRASSSPTYSPQRPGAGRRSWNYDNEFEASRGYDRGSRYEESERSSYQAHGPSAESHYGMEPWYDRAGEGTYYVVRCRDLMTKDVTTCTPNTSLREVAEMMESENVGSIPVVENGRLLGLVTDRDIVCRILAEGRDTRSAVAREAMTDDLVTCLPEESVIDAIHKMGEYQVRRIPVCDPTGRLRGILSMGDVALEGERDDEVACALEQVSRSTPLTSHRSW